MFQPHAYATFWLRLMPYPCRFHFQFPGVGILLFRTLYVMSTVKTLYIFPKEANLTVPRLPRRSIGPEPFQFYVMYGSPHCAMRRPRHVLLHFVCVRQESPTLVFNNGADELTNAWRPLLSNEQAVFRVSRGIITSIYISPLCYKVRCSSPQPRLVFIWRSSILWRFK